MATSRQTPQESPRPALVDGDALTRYRLGLALQLGRNGLALSTGVPARPVSVELAVVLAAGRLVAVDVVEDGGFSSLAARAAEGVRRAGLAVPVPPELGDGLLRVSVVLRFEP